MSLSKLRPGKDRGSEPWGHRALEVRGPSPHGRRGRDFATAGVDRPVQDSNLEQPWGVVEIFGGIPSANVFRTLALNPLRVNPLRKP